MADNSLLEGFEEEMLRSSLEEALLTELHGIPDCLADPMLLSHPREYARLFRRGRVGVFYMRKKNGDSRMMRLQTSED